MDFNGFLLRFTWRRQVTVPSTKMYQSVQMGLGYSTHSNTPGTILNKTHQKGEAGEPEKTHSELCDMQRDSQMTKAK